MKISSTNTSSLYPLQDTKSEYSSEKNITELSAGEKVQVNKLQQIDSDVRAHESAHIAAGGSAVSGGASFSYQEGPDGKLYAIGGEVPISISGGSNPQESIENARQVQAAALAPANPSPQDYKVAASAAALESQARQELNAEKTQEQKDKGISAYAESSSDSKNSHKIDIQS